MDFGFVEVRRGAKGGMQTVSRVVYYSGRLPVAAFGGIKDTGP